MLAIRSNERAEPSWNGGVRPDSGSPSGSRGAGHVLYWMMLGVERGPARRARAQPTWSEWWARPLV